MLAHFVLLDEEEEDIEDQAQDNVEGNHIDEEGEDSLQQDRGGVLNLDELLSGEGLVLGNP